MRNTRTIAAAAFDRTSGTAYAFEVDDSRIADHSVVIVCNHSLPSICYRLSPRDVDSSDVMRELGEGLERERTRRTASSPDLTVGR